MLPDLPFEYSASAWASCFRWRPYLEETGMSVDILPATSAGVYRAFTQPRPFPGAGRLYWNGIALPSRLRQLAVCRRYDVVLIHRSLLQLQSPPFLEEIVAKIHARVIYQLDDAIYLGNPGIDRRIAMADMVMCTSELVAEHARKLNRNVVRVDEAVDTSYYTRKTGYDLADPPTLVWAGQPLNYKYLAMLEKPLARLAKRFDFQVKIVSRTPYRLSSPGIKTVWIPYSPHDEMDHIRSADIGLMPLKDGPYQRAKGNYKTKVYMASGLPLVCSPVGMNIEFISDGETGLFASSAEEWEEKLGSLIGDRALRERLGCAARRSVDERYSMERLGPKMVEAFASV
jgi:glycosyltransferase involved in cell wall biosynthesis